MSKLTDTQRVILSAASQRTDRFALPLPKSLNGGAAHKVINALVEKGFLKEVKANRKLNDPVWRENDEGHGLTLIITDAGLEVMGIESHARKPKMTEKATPVASSDQATPAEQRERKSREGTKQSLMIELLKRPEGATIAEIVESTGWQSHTVRGAMAGALKKKLGLNIVSAKDDARGRFYKIA